MFASILFALFGYVIGGIPFGLLLTKLAGYGDIRAIGSGNIGATNVLRTGNKKLAFATLLLDGGKGAAAVGIAHACGANENGALLTGLFAVLGHVFPACLKFRGGKGVATALGVLLAWAWPVGTVACLAWLAMALIFRLSSLAALTAVLAAPAAAWPMLHDGHLTGAAGLIAVLVWIRHRANIGRLLAGTEPSIGRGTGAAPHS